MDLSSTQQSRIFGLDVLIGTPTEPIGPSCQQSLFCPVLPSFASISKPWAFSHASSILKKREIIFPPKVKVFKILLQFVDYRHSAMPHSGKIPMSKPVR